MRKRKFKSGDWIKPSKNAPNWLKKEWEKKKIVKAVIIRYISYYGHGEYVINAYDSSNNKVRFSSSFGDDLGCNLSVRSHHLAPVIINESREAALAKIEDYRKQIMKLEKAKSRVEGAIEMMDILGTDTIDDRAVVIAKTLVNQKLCKDMKDAYSHALKLKDI